MTRPSSYNPFVAGSNDVGLGLSALRSLADEELHLPAGVRLAVPDSLIRLAELVREGSREHAQFLKRIIVGFQPKILSRAESPDGNELASRFAMALLELHHAQTIEVIEEVDEKVLAHLGDSFPTYVVSLSPPSYFVRRYLAKLYSWSLRKGALILERGRAVLNKVSHHITTIQFPDELAPFFRVKDKLSGRIFARVGGRPVKYFVCIAVAGLGLEYMPASAAGLAIAVVDP